MAPLYSPLPIGLRSWIRATLAKLPLNLCLDFWGDPIWAAGGDHPPITLKIRHPGVVRQLIFSRNPLTLVDAYLAGWVDLDGRLDDMIPLVQQNPHVKLSRINLAQAFNAALSALTLPSLPLGKPMDPSPIVHTRDLDQAAIQHHYDAGNDFYQLWLDPLLVYSCAHFEQPDMTLAQAQEAKLDLICRKLNLKPGETLLDVGCGWGSLLTWAVNHYGVKGYGITLSQEQLAFNHQRIAQSGWGDQLTVSLLDYRDLPPVPTFDKIVSVGMIEHVGIQNYAAYFQTLLATLKPGGLFLNHGINSAIPWNGSRWGEKFIRRYIFPNGELATLSITLTAAETAGWEVVDVDNWRPHYAQTARCWADQFQAKLDQIMPIMGERRAEIWRLYLVGCITAFQDNHIGLFQTLLRRRSDLSWNLPLTRQQWLG